MSLDLTSPTFLSQLSSLFPSNSTLTNPWFYTAAIVFAANNKYSEVAAVYVYALSLIASGDHEARLELTRKFQEALFKTNVLYGAPKMINSLLEWIKFVPPDLKSAHMFRDPTLSIADLGALGKSLFQETYGESTEKTLETLSTIHPDFSYYCLTLVYGPLYSFSGILDPLETSFAMIAALIGVDVPLQIGWHFEGARRHGGSSEEIGAVREIAVRTMERMGREVGDVPEVGLGE